MVHVIPEGLCKCLLQNYSACIIRDVLVKYLHQGSSRKQVKVHIESQNSQGNGWDVIQTHLKQLGCQEQQSQVGSPLSVPHTEKQPGKKQVWEAWYYFSVIWVVPENEQQNQLRDRFVVPSDHWEEFRFSQQISGYIKIKTINQD